MDGHIHIRLARATTRASNITYGYGFRARDTGLGIQG